MSDQSIYIPKTQLGDAWVGAIQIARGGANMSPAERPSRFNIELFRSIDAFETDGCDEKIIIYTGADDFRTIDDGGVIDQETFSRDVIASRTLSRLSKLVQSGAKALDGRLSTIEVPVLGAITVPALKVAEPSLDRAGALSIYRNLTLQEGDAAIWEPNAFFFSSGVELTGGQSEIDLTGRARFLMHGPYVELPPGVWSGELLFHFDPGGMSPSIIRFEWGYGETFTREDVVLSRAGQYTMKLTTRWDSAAAAQFRLSLIRPVFHGRLSVTRCRVTLDRALSPLSQSS